MFKIVATKKFKKGIKRYKNDLAKAKEIKKIMLLLRSGKKLPTIYKEHRLKGKFKDFYECHILPDLLLIFQRIPEDRVITLADIGSRSYLF